MKSASDLPIALAAAGLTINGVSILQAVDLTLKPGGPAILMGPNGAGKSTLIRLASGLIAPSEGRISWNGRSSTEGSRIAVVFQRPVMLRRSTAANIVFARRMAGFSADQAAVRQLLERVSLTPLADRPARSLSGGEQQRLALGRALAREPEILFLDEPTANLDPASAKMTEDIIIAAAAGGVKIVLATHDIGQAKRLGEDVVFLAAGRIAEQAKAAEFFKNPRSEIARTFLAGGIALTSAQNQQEESLACEA